MKISFLAIFIVVVLKVSSQCHSGHPLYFGTKQYNEIGAEIFADAPWRMNRLDVEGNDHDLPLVVYCHDADGFGSNFELVAIDIKIKNAVDSSFEEVLKFDTLSFDEFESLFSGKSINDQDLNMQSFDSALYQSSNRYTINFRNQSNLWPDTTTFVDLTQKYWYFVFSIPGVILEQYEDIIDVEVYFNLNYESDRFSRLRVFRNSENLSTLDGWYRGDTHLHSIYTLNTAEIGLPLYATKQAAKHIGLDWITTTDHTSDFDNYGKSIESNWERMKSEVMELNQADSSMIYLQGLEVHSDNSVYEIVHFLAYPPVENPYGMQFIGDGNGDIIGTSYTIDSVLTELTEINGFSYAAHPFAEGDVLPTFPIDGGIWNLGDVEFPWNGQDFNWSLGNVACNNINELSDLYSHEENKLIKDHLIGGQIWNIRNTLYADGSLYDPWNVLYQEGVSEMSAITHENPKHHHYRLQQGIEVINHINTKGLRMKNFNDNVDNYKFFYSAGSDAHGSFNFTNTEYYFGTGDVHNGGVGRPSTVVYCENGMGSDGANVLNALKNGNSVITDGPLLEIGIDIDNDNEIDVIVGQDSVLSYDVFDNSKLVVNTGNSDEFGFISSITVYVGTEYGEFPYEIDGVNGVDNVNILINLNDIIIGSGLNIQNLANDYIYFRAELETLKEYEELFSITKMTVDQFNCYTNPIWLKSDLYAGDKEKEKNKVKIEPNIFQESVFIIQSEFKYDRFELFDIKGNLIIQGELELNNSKLNLNQLSNGVYLINLISDNDQVLKRIVKY